MLLREYALAANAFEAALKVDPEYQIARANLNFLRQRLRAGTPIAAASSAGTYSCQRYAPTS